MNYFFRSAVLAAFAFTAGFLANNLATARQPPVTAKTILQTDVKGGVFEEAVVQVYEFEPGAALALIERERCSVYYGMANMARALLEHPDHPGRRLGAMRTGLTIGPPEDITLTIQALGAAELCTVYGSTETYGNCAVTDAHDPLPLRLATQGLPLPGMTIRAVDPATRAPLRRRDRRAGGARLHHAGYFSAPELDDQAFDTWFLTGDLGSIGRWPRAIPRPAEA